MSVVTRIYHHVAVGRQGDFIIVSKELLTASASEVVVRHADTTRREATATIVTDERSWAFHDSFYLLGQALQIFGLDVEQVDETEPMMGTILGQKSIVKLH